MPPAPATGGSKKKPVTKAVAPSGESFLAANLVSILGVIIVLLIVVVVGLVWYYSTRETAMQQPMPPQYGGAPPQGYPPQMAMQPQQQQMMAPPSSAADGHINDTKHEQLVKNTPKEEIDKFSNMNKTTDNIGIVEVDDSEDVDDLDDEDLDALDD